jgi:Protein of unknown function (DUF3043)
VRTIVSKQKTGQQTPPPVETSSANGKGRATPTRRQQEEARRRPLVPTDRKEARREYRQKMAESREKARVGMAAGDERFMPQRDRGPQRRFVRDFVDARTGLSEFILPIMFLAVIVTALPSGIQQGLTAGVWGFIALAVIDVLIMSFILQRRMRTVFGADRIERGVRWYAAMRSFQLRRLRMPKPQVKRGQYPDYS